MSLNDRVALIIGRTIIRCEELAVQNEQLKKELESVRQAQDDTDRDR